MNPRLLIVLIFSAIFMKEAWVLVAKNESTFDPFPYYDVELQRQTYIAFACYNAMMLLWAYILGTMVTKYNEIIRVWFYIQAVEFFDYFLTYNQPWFTVPWTHIEVGITFCKFTILSALIIYKFESWKQ